MEIKQKSRLLDEALSAANEFVKMYEVYSDKPLFSIPDDLVQAEKEFLKHLEKETDSEKLQQALDEIWTVYRWTKANMSDNLSSLIFMSLCWPIATRINRLAQR